jgi:hypothetical protein
MSWPQRLTLTFLSVPDGECIRNLAVGLTITMERKNDYHLGPFLTDQHGSIELGIEEVERSIQEVQGESLMDYSPIDLRARPKFDIEISIESKQGLRSRAERLKPFFPDRSGRLDRLAAVASNPEEGSLTLRVEVDEGTRSIFLPSGSLALGAAACGQGDEGTTALVTPLGAPARADTSDPLPGLLKDSPSQRR